MSSNQNYYSILADVVVLLHFAFVAFIVLGFVVIWVGYFFRWAFVRNRYFRLAHLLAMGYVLAEALLGITCPLTNWEADLRRLAGESQIHTESFMEHWTHRLMFFDLKPETFTVIYAFVFVLIVLTYWVVKPEWTKAATSIRRE